MSSTRHLSIGTLRTWPISPLGILPRLLCRNMWRFRRMRCWQLLWSRGGSQSKIRVASGDDVWYRLGVGLTWHNVRLILRDITIIHTNIWYIYISYIIYHI
jgi:hypothetical protein